MFGIWNLEFGTSLELGTWNLEGSIMTPLSCYLLLSAFIFTIGLAGALTRRNAIIVLIGIELMLNAANLNFIAFWRFSEHPEALTGIMFVIFSIGVAAAEAAVGLALIIAIYRHYRSANVDDVNSLKG
jgi:NADH-quinone oxidoreductase subunit K